jgi:RND family efflux transporter MFP subunit
MFERSSSQGFSAALSLVFSGALGAVLIVALLLSACGGDKTPPVKTVSAPTVRATLYDAQECRSLPAEVRSQNSVTLSSKATGAVVEVLATEGQVVDKGQPILRIDDAELRQHVEGLQSSARQAALQRQTLGTLTALAKVNMGRMQKLFAQEVISRAELDNATTEYQALKTQEQAQAANAASASHQGAEAKSRLGYNVVTAPFKGVLSRRYVDQGAFVSAGAPLADVDEVQGGYELEAQADESLMGTMRKGLEVLGLVPSVSSRPFLTRLTTVVDRVDPATRTFKVRAAYNVSAPADNATATANATAKTPANVAADAPGQPHAGMFGKICVPMLHARKLLIPAASVRQRGELATVLVVDEKGVLRLRLVKIGGAYLKAEIDGQSFIVQAQDEVLADKSPASGLMLEVLSGLTEGEVLVNGGPETLREGDHLAAQKQ